MSDAQQKQAPQAPPIKGLDIRYEEGNKAYYVSVELPLMERGNTENDLFYVWLLSRWEDETIVISINGFGRGSSGEGYLTFLNALKVCAARTIARVDHIHEGVDALALLVCDEWVVSDYGMVIFEPVVGYDRTTNVCNQAKAAGDATLAFYEGGVEKGWLMPEELSVILGGDSVLLTPQILKQRARPLT